MGGAQSNVVDLVQNTKTNILQLSQENCKANCSNYSGDNTIIINGTEIKDNLDFNQQCVTNVNCIMESQLDNQVQNILSSTIDQEQQTEQSFLDFTVSAQSNVTVAKQNITNNITQILQSSCTATSSNIRQNDLIVLSNSEIGGSVDLSQNSSATSQCTMNNLAKQVTFNSEQAKVSQSQKITSVFAIIAIAIVIIIVVVIVAFLFLFGSGAKKAISSGVDTITKNPELLLA